MTFTGVDATDEKPDAFVRVESLFHAALEQPAEQREAFLRETETDPHIRAWVWRLLEQDVASTPDPVSMRLGHIDELITPRSIGPYRLLRELGDGGMGTVFLAERDVAGTAQQVALKLLHGFPTEAGKRRMARERRLLASLNHPHIAGHIDGGETTTGQPYLVMEYVEGTSLAHHLRDARPGLPARLDLFLHVCDAVQHAHQRLVLHRDIKPSNLLVRADGTPVLLDFGVGQLIADGEPTAHTATLAFTPGYAAPEQIRGESATTATDVFGLGALLFDLLTGQRLSELSKGGSEVPVPSQHAAAADRRRLRGDLDLIVRKATAADPDRRYRTVAALAEDVANHLRGRPIAAGPDSAWYRLRKFAARHRLAFAAAVVAVATAWIVLAQQREARTHAGNDRTLAELFRISVLAATQNARSGGRDDVRPLLHQAEHRLRSTAGSDQPQFLARGLASLADAYYEQSDYAQSERLWLEILALHPDEPMFRARTLGSLASLANKRVDAEGMMRFSREGIDALKGCDDRESTMLRLSLQFSLARSYWISDDTAHALQVIDQAIQVARTLGSEHEAQLAGFVRQRGVMFSSIGRLKEADRDLTEAMERMTTATPASRISIMQSLAVLRLREGRGDSGRELAARALIESLRIYGDDHVETARAWLTMAKLWSGTGTDLSRARVALHRAETLIANRLGSSHPMMQDILEESADLEFTLHHRSSALAYARRAEALAFRTYGESSSRTRTCIARRRHFEAAPVLGINGSPHKPSTRRI